MFVQHCQTYCQKAAVLVPLAINPSALTERIRGLQRLRQQANGRITAFHFTMVGDSAKRRTVR